jgi:hypothetical protein
MHSADWLFTHVRVSKLPPYLEAKVPLVFCTPDALGFAVAAELHRHAPGRVVFWTGYDESLQLNRFDKSSRTFGSGELFAEYVPPGIYSDKPEGLH